MQRVLVYLLRRDLRVADNPILHEISKLFAQSHAPFTHLLPLYIFPAQQIEVSGFLSSNAERSPYPEARSQVGGFWRCGPHRAKFIAESVWDVKKSLESVGGGLEIRAGLVGDVVEEVLRLLQADHQDTEVSGVWMTDEEGVEEKREVRHVRRVVEARGTVFKLWRDEKYFVDEFKNQVSPLRDAPRGTLSAPKSLPPFPSLKHEDSPTFSVPDTLDGIVASLQKPLEPALGLRDPPAFPSGAQSAFPFSGGESSGHERVKHLLASGSMSQYKDTRNGMLGPDFSTKLSAWLALGSITARQVHKYMLDFEEARTELGKGAPGYGKGENKGTAAVRFELLWRDYFRLTTRKFGPRLFRASGFMNMTDIKWTYDKDTILRVLEGRTGMGLVDASQRELFLTGYTSNRARQNVASFLAKHLNIDWRIGAEWYESLLIDYDLGSNWGNWQYNAGVGNDSRDRKFNPVKQAHDYDVKAESIKTWVEEVADRRITPEEAWQAWKIEAAKKKEVGLEGNVGAQNPLVRLQYQVRDGGGGRKNGNRKKRGGR